MDTNLVKLGVRMQEGLTSKKFQSSYLIAWLSLVQKPE